MQMRFWMASFVFAATALGGCDCGETPPATKDASGPFYDAGKADNPVLDIIGTDTIGTDTTATDARADDAFAPDALVPDDAFVANDAAVDDTGTTDSTTEDAAGMDVVSPDTTAHDATLWDTDTPDAAGPDTFGLDTQAWDTTVIAPDAAVADAVATPDAVTVDAALPDTITFDTFVNVPPTAEAGTVAAVLPDGQVTLAGSAADDNLPNDSLTYLWTFAGAVPVGVSITDASTLTPTLSVNRSTYASGPEDLAITLTLTVTDAAGETGTDTTEVVVLDERGPHVDNTSTYSGTGYSGTGASHGYCGQQAHPCNNIDDALLNLRGAIDDGATYAAQVQVATTGTTYSRGAKIHLDDNLGLICGFDPSSWQRVAGTSRTHIHYSGPYGVHVTSDSVTLEGCHIEGIASPGGLSYQQRAAVYVESEDVDIIDNTIIGNSGQANNVSNVYGVLLDAPNPDSQVDIADNDIEGGNSSSSAAGIQATGGLPSISDNTIVGGRANSVSGMVLGVDLGTAGERAVVSGNTISGGEGGSGQNQGASGMIISAGDPLIENNPRVLGGTSTQLNMGAWFASHNGTVEVNDNNFFGVEAPVGAATTVGAVVTANTIFSGNHFEGGFSAWTVGLLADGDFDDDGLDQPFFFTSDSDTMIGGNASWAAGLSVSNGASGTMNHTTITGASATASATTVWGVSLGDAASLVLSEGQINAGNGVNSSFGVNLSSTARYLSLSNTEVVSGNAIANESVSAGILVQAGILQVQGGSVTSGNASEASVGVALDCGASIGPVSRTHAITDTVIVSGQAEMTAGVWAENCGAIDLTDVTATAGVATGELSFGLAGVAMDVSPIGGTYQAGAVRGGSSFGIAFTASGTNTHLVANGTAATSGVAREVSAGFMFTDASAANGVIGCSARGNSASISAGLFCEELVRALDIENSTLTAGVGSRTSAGLWFEEGCDGCSISRNRISGGSADNAAGLDSWSMGARFVAEGPYDTDTMVFANIFEGGSSPNSAAVVMDGEAGNSLRVLNNNLHGGGGSDSLTTTYGAYFGREIIGAGVNDVGVLGGNMIHPGLGAHSYNIYENCDSGRRAEPVVLGGRNNNLYPAGTTALLADADNTSIPCNIILIVDIGVVNTVDQYEQLDTFDKTWSVNPLFDETGYRFTNDTLADRAITTESWWTLTTTEMVDYDNKTRPIGASYDIGCWEMPL